MQGSPDVVSNVILFIGLVVIICYRLMLTFKPAPDNVSDASRALIQILIYCRCLWKVITSFLSQVAEESLETVTDRLKEKLPEILGLTMVLTLRIYGCIQEKFKQGLHLSDASGPVLEILIEGSFMWRWIFSRPPPAHPHPPLSQVAEESLETVTENIKNDMNALNDMLKEKSHALQRWIPKLAPPEMKCSDDTEDTELALAKYDEGSRQLTSQPEPTSGGHDAIEAKSCGHSGHFLTFGEDCFLASTLVAIGDPGATNMRAECQTKLLPISHIKTKDFVKGVFGFAQVLSISIHPREQVELIRLCADNNTSQLTVTPSHRIVTGIEGRESKTALAGNLNEGDSILCSNGVQKLTRVEKITCTVNIAEVSFMPDVPIEAFDPVPKHAILSKGKPRIRRGGMHKRSDKACDSWSIPDTQYSWPEAELDV